MPLYDINHRRQEGIGRGEHWGLFWPFQSRPLYDAIVDEIESHIEALARGRDVIDSSWLGSEILRRLEADAPELFEGEDPEQVGGLFGMALWHYLAGSGDDWYFVPKEHMTDEPEGMKYFRRK